MDNIDNVTLMAMVRSGLCVFYLTLGAGFVVLNERKEAHKYVLGILLMLLGFGMARDAISGFYPILTETFYSRLFSLIDLTEVPLYAMFVFSLIYKRYLSFKRTVFNLLPFILLPCLFVVWKAPVVFYCGLAMPVSYAIWAVPNIFLGLKKYEKAIVDNYSYQDNINADWLKVVVGLLVINLLLSLYIYQYPSNWMYGIYYAYGLLIWIYISYKTVGMKCNKWNPEADTPDAIIKPADVVEKKDEPSLLWHKELNRCFVEDEMFLNPELVMQDVANKIGVNRTYLSSLLNNQLDTTFYDYVNGFRTEYAENLLRTTGNKIGSIAQDSGFNSFNTFLYYFNKKYGCNPSEYRNRLYK